MLRWSLSVPAVVAVFALSSAQTGTQVTSLVPLSLTEQVGLGMNKVRVLEVVDQAWAESFGLQPGAKVVRTDAENGLFEGSARLNYRSKLLVEREETLGPITFLITIQARNGQCQVRVHGFVHKGDRNAPGGGLDLGTLYEGDAPAERYPGMGLNISRKLHADARAFAVEKTQELMRRFCARLRLLDGQ